MSEPDEAWLTAVHESAHAIADLALGCEVVEVVANGGQGYSRSRGRSSAIACLAGPCAEWKIRHPGTLPTAADFRRHRRVPDIARAIERLGGDDPARLLACWRQARTLVDTHWDAIENLAGLLRRRGRVSGAAVEAVWRGVSFAA